MKCETEGEEFVEFFYYADDERIGVGKAFGDELLRKADSYKTYGLYNRVTGEPERPSKIVRDKTNGGIERLRVWGCGKIYFTMYLMRIDQLTDFLEKLENEQPGIVHRKNFFNRIWPADFLAWKIRHGYKLGLWYHITESLDNSGCPCLFSAHCEVFTPEGLEEAQRQMEDKYAAMPSIKQVAPLRYVRRPHFAAGIATSLDEWERIEKKMFAGYEECLHQTECFAIALFKKTAQLVTKNTILDV